jgi:ATP-binding cassette, subfamily D (ALD), member 3
MYAQELRLEG